MAKKTKKELSSAQSGGLLLNNLLALGFFFGAASLSVVFFPLYLGYFVNSGLQVYERRVQISDDIKSFLSKAMKV